MIVVAARRDSLTVESRSVQTSPSGLVQMVFDGVPNNPAGTTDNEQRFQAGVQYIARQVRQLNAWAKDPSFTSVNVYAMFATPVAYVIDESGVIAHDVAVGVEPILNLMIKVNGQPNEKEVALGWDG